MGFDTTDDDNVAFYDTTTGIAFGPVFDSNLEAEDFAEWLKETHSIEDPRRVRDRELEVLKSQWEESLTEDDDPDDREEEETTDQNLEPAAE